MPDVVASFGYQSQKTERSIVSTGRVGVKRDATGSDDNAFGMHPGAAARGLCGHEPRPARTPLRGTREPGLC